MGRCVPSGRIYAFLMIQYHSLSWSIKRAGFVKLVLTVFTTCLKKTRMIYWIQILPLSGLVHKRLFAICNIKFNPTCFLSIHLELHGGSTSSKEHFDSKMLLQGLLSMPSELLHLCCILLKIYLLKLDGKAKMGKHLILIKKKPYVENQCLI